MPLYICEASFATQCKILVDHLEDNNLDCIRHTNNPSQIAKEIERFKKSSQKSKSYFYQDSNQQLKI